MNEKDFEQFSKELVRDLRKLDRIDLDVIAKWVAEKITAKETPPWGRHFDRQAWVTPLSIKNIAEECRCDVSLVRRVFLAGPGVSPGNWTFRDQRGPLWGSTMLAAWRKVLSEIDESTLPPDGPFKIPVGPRGAFGPHEDWSNDGVKRE